MVSNNKKCLIFQVYLLILLIKDCFAILNKISRVSH